MFVARLNHLTTEGLYNLHIKYLCMQKFSNVDTLREFFSKYGKIENCCIARDIG